MKEIWKDTDVEGYRVSNLGRVMSLKQNDVKILKPGETGPQAKIGEGYLVVHIGGRLRKVSHLVLEAFVGPRPKRMEACHFPDRNRKNNRLDNLRWGSKSENMQDAIKHGTMKHQIMYGTKNWNTKYPLSLINKLRRLYKTGKYSQSELAIRFGVSRPYTNHLLNGKYRLKGDTKYASFL